MNKKLNRKSSLSMSGFSLVEMLIASTLVVLLSATSYQILTGQGSKQRESVWGQKQNTMMLTALDRFKRDVMKIDSNWPRYGVAAVYPAQGYAFQNNFYVDTLVQEYGLMDGVSFITRDMEKSDLYSLSNDATAPAAIAPADQLYGDWLNLNEPSTTIQANDWVLLFQPGKYVLGVVTDVGISAPARIKIREPNEFETVLTQPNIWGRSSGYVTRLGVVPGSYDWNTMNTAATEDDTIRMTGTQTKVQVVQPIAYGIEWATQDGHPYGVGSSYLLDEHGNRKKMLVRTEFTGAGTNHEYVTEVTQVGLTYDALKSTVAGADSLSGFTNGDIVKNIGRESTTEVQFVNLAVAPDDSEGFISTSKILSLRMFLSNSSPQDAKEKIKYNEVNVAIDPSLNNNRYQNNGKSAADNSENVTDTNSLNNEQQIGQPLYFRNPGSDDISVITPITYLNKSDGTFQNGKLVVMNKSGCPITSNSCLQDSASEITFQSSGDNSYFYPNTMVQVTDDPTKNKILVGGFSVTVDNSTLPPTIKREPAMAKIEFPIDQTLYDTMKGNTSSGTLCSLSGCKLEYLDTSSLGAGEDRFKDTAGGFATDSDNNVYVASLTHENGSDSSLSIYKTRFGGASPLGLKPFEEVVVDSSGVAEDRVISAIAQSPIKINGTDYLPMCLSRSLADGGIPQTDGKIYLYNLAGTATAPIEIGKQNFKCTSLQQVNGNLLIGGKLVFQVMQYEEIAAIVNGDTIVVPTFYTDEIAQHIDAGDINYYADAYKTLPSIYNEPAPSDYQQVLGYNTGLSASPLSPTEFGIVVGNRAMISQDGGVTGTETVDQQDFTTLTVTMGGMAERVLATINTDAQNLNRSEVDAQFGEAQLDIPSVLLPGVFYFNPVTPRQILAALPTITTGMSEANWFDFYIDYIDIHDLKSGAEITAIDQHGSDGGVSCSKSIPQTCGGGGEYVPAEEDPIGDK